jgi:hypothetical protein
MAPAIVILYNYLLLGVKYPRQRNVEWLIDISQQPHCYGQIYLIPGTAIAVRKPGLGIEED